MTYQLLFNICTKWEKRETDEVNVFPCWWKKEFDRFVCNIVCCMMYDVIHMHNK